MELILMILTPFPIGFFVKDRLTAFVVYIAVHSFAFVVQSVFLLTDWAGGSQEAFGPFPKANSADVWAYAGVNLAIFLVGLGLVQLGHRLGSRRRSQRTGAVHLDPVAG